MKISLIVAGLLLVSFTGFGQNGFLPVDAAKKVVYADRASVPIGKDKIYQLAQQWVAKSFGNYANAVESENKETGRLTLRTYAPVNSARFEYVRFVMTITCEEQQYRAVIDQVEGVSKSQSVMALGPRENDLVKEKEVLLNAEGNRKKKAQLENALNEARSDNEAVNQSIYGMLSSLKLLITEAEH